MPTKIVQPESNAPPGFSRRAGELRTDILTVSFDRLVARSGCASLSTGSGTGKIFFNYFDKPVVCNYPEIIFYSEAGNLFSEFQQLLFLYYFATADGTELTQKYVTFADLPGGRMYSLAFQGYSGDELVKRFKEDLRGFQRACELEGGQLISLGHAAYEFSVLPRVTIQLVYWQGDEDFSSSCKILFDAAITHYLPIDACAIIGSNVTKKLIKRAQV